VVNEIAQRSIAVVKMRLPYTDRGSLSQAWFSALHLAGDAPSPAYGGQARTAPAAQGRAPLARRGVPTAPITGVGSNARRSGATLRRANMGGSEVTQRRYRMEHRIPMRASFAGARSYPPFASSLTVGLDGARVQLVLRRQGETLHVIALCAPCKVDLVRRALACAQAHLRARGEVLHAAVHGCEVGA